MEKYLIQNVTVVNEGVSEVLDVLIERERIAKIAPNISAQGLVSIIDGTGKHLLPGVIDDQVHFREPGLTHKATIYTEAKAAVAGGVTSFMEMPNTIPNALTQPLLEDKYNIAERQSLANYSFFMGTSNSNVDEVLRTNDKRRTVCGIKIFMGSSTGNMLVDNYLTLDKIFSEAEVLIATHCEDERVIAANLAGLDGVPLNPSHHPIIRDAEACFSSSYSAVQLAKKYDTRLHVLHITTARELQLFGNMMPLAEKRITAEVCVHHLHFTANDYDTLGYALKCNPAIKAPENKAALWQALLDDRLDIIATDHAPHTWAEKAPPYNHAHAGLPLVQHALPLMLHYVKQGQISIEKVVQKMSHDVAICFQIENRGYIREGYFADLVLVDLNMPYAVTKENLLYKCGWSPLEGFSMPATISHTFINGHLAYGNGVFDESKQGYRLSFNR
ncbi:MAG: dihydroorotase [Bacteroidetes bacterium]|nr:MAG: dihydroorotase [Bacteroidota bacterium]